MVKTTDPVGVAPPLVVGLTVAVKVTEVAGATGLAVAVTTVVDPWSAGATPLATSVAVAGTPLGDEMTAVLASAPVTVDASGATWPLTVMVGKVTRAE